MVGTTCTGRLVPGPVGMGRIVGAPNPEYNNIRARDARNSTLVDSLETQCFVSELFACMLHRTVVEQHPVFLGYETTCGPQLFGSVIKLKLWVLVYEWSIMGGISETK